MMFFLGAMTGGVVGFVILALLTAGKLADKDAEIALLEVDREYARAQVRTLKKQLKARQNDE